MKKCILESHRGVCTDAPDNTMAAFRLAVELGYGMIELDTKFTKDGRCVVLHDRTVNRTGRYADGREIEPDTKIAELTYEEARKLDFGIWFSEKYRGEKIPAFEEALQVALDSGVPLKLDNVWQTHTDAEQETFFEIIEKMGAVNHVGFTVTKPEYAEKVLERFPSAQIHYDGQIDDESLAAIAAVVPKEQLTVWQRLDNGYGSGWCKVPTATDESVCKIKKIGKLGLWLLKKPEELAEAVEHFDADVVETDGSLKPVK